MDETCCVPDLFLWCVEVTCYRLVSGEVDVIPTGQTEVHVDPVARFGIRVLEQKDDTRTRT